MAVSPFDGINRIRFKGSPDCGFRIADSIRVQHSEIRIRRDSQPCGSPENFVDTVYYILVNSPTRRFVKYRSLNLVTRSEWVC